MNNILRQYPNSYDNFMKSAGLLSGPMLFVMRAGGKNLDFFDDVSSQKCACRAIAKGGRRENSLY
jgi:hypothetical protein